MFNFWKKPPEEAYIKPDMTQKKETPKSQEHYRIGYTPDGLVTLTLMDGSYSMTLSMNKAGCEQMIRMIRATYTEEQNESSNQ